MKLIELKKREDEKIDYIGGSCIGFVVCKLYERRVMYIFCYFCIIKGGIIVGSVFIEFGNRVIYRCV